MTKIMKRTSRHSRGKVCTRSKPNGKTQKPSDDTGRTSTGICRLCHGKFSTRHLRKAFAQLQEESRGVCSAFCRDFQQLLGIPMHRDPSLSQFICNTCHAQFYKCHSILLDFRSRVNLTPLSRDRVGTEHSSSREDMALFRSEHGCLHSLVSWTHTHAEGCHSIPDLQKVLEGQYWGALKVVWGCVDGHSYVMDTSTVPLRPSSIEESSREHHEDKSVTHQNHSKTDADSCEEETSPAADLLLLDQHADADSDQSDRLRSVLRGEAGPGRRKSSSSEDSLDLLPDPSPSKKSEVTTHQAKCRKKPGPKPGWKNKSEREELPTIYKCPHQGCTAVYRGADGLKKHIKEHHEEVRERPCPHPGCNKVFMIDRYLQRHVKLIHTEVRNYICDQCGQTFKQRKHLSVHQMRHSGAKPLQCEVCGFQCRQRASLKYHMTKHKAEAELEFACVTCAKRFEKAHNLNVHMSMVHPLMQGVAAQAPPHSINYMLEGLQAKLTEPS